MCRWAAYIGPKIFLEDVITAPDRSLIHQSLHASEGKTETNGDGFGVAWYDHKPVPGLFRDVLPAWSDPNLRHIAAQVCSGLFMAHVRASTGTAISRNNCHPFVVDRWSFMHNGQLGDYHRIRRHIDMMIPDHLYDHRLGATDSEALFLLAVGEGLERDPKAAFERAAGQLEAMACSAGIEPRLRLTAALADGERLYAMRYATDDSPPTLYHHAWEVAGGRAVVSEPLETCEDAWESIPPGSWAEFSPGGVRVEPFRPTA